MATPQIIPERSITSIALSLFSENKYLLPAGSCFQINYSSGTYRDCQKSDCGMKWVGYPDITNLEGLKWWIQDIYDEDTAKKVIELVESSNYITQSHVGDSSKQRYTFQCYKMTEK